MARLGRSQPFKPLLRKFRFADPVVTFSAGWASDSNQLLIMLRKNVASQVVTFNGVNATTGAALTGATVTTKVTIDGTQGASAGTLTELGTGQYKYVPTQAETNGGSIGFSFTATNMVPVNLHCFTIGQDPALATLDTNVTKLLGTAWLTPGTAGTPDVNVKTWNALATVALPLVPTTAGRTLDVSATGEAGVDWANVGSPTTALALTGTTIAVTQKVDVDTIKTNPVVNAGTITFPTTATLASTTGAVGSVTGAVGSVTGAVGSVTGAVGSVTGNVGGNVTGSIGSLAAQAKTDVKAQVDASLTTDVIADSIPADGSRPTLAQACYMLTQFMLERSVSATTVTVKKPDGTTTLFTLTLNDAAAPTSITRAT